MSIPNVNNKPISTSPIPSLSSFVNSKKEGEQTEYTKRANELAVIFNVAEIDTDYQSHKSELHNFFAESSAEDVKNFILKIDLDGISNLEKHKLITSNQAKFFKDIKSVDVNIDGKVSHDNIKNAKALAISQIVKAYYDTSYRVLDFNIPYLNVLPPRMFDEGCQNIDTIKFKENCIINFASNAFSPLKSNNILFVIPASSGCLITKDGTKPESEDDVANMDDLRQEPKVEDKQQKYNLWYMKGCFSDFVYARAQIGSDQAIVLLNKLNSYGSDDIKINREPIDTSSSEEVDATFDNANKPEEVDATFDNSNKPEEADLIFASNEQPDYRQEAFSNPKKPRIEYHANSAENNINPIQNASLKKPEFNQNNNSMHSTPNSCEFGDHKDIKSAQFGLSTGGITLVRSKNFKTGQTQTFVPNFNNTREIVVEPTKQFLESFNRLKEQNKSNV